MSRSTKASERGGRMPKLRRKRNRNGRDTAYATFSGCKVWFGYWGDPGAVSEFESFLARWLANGRVLPEEPGGADALTVERLVDRYRRHLDERHDDAWHRNNDARVKGALDPLVALFGVEFADEFGPSKLMTVRRSLIQGGKLCRSEINKRVQGVTKVFKWGARSELVPASVWHRLQVVEPLAEGDFGVREGKKREPVSEEVFLATLPYLAPVPRAIVELLWWTGARPSEILNLCPQDIDRRGQVWTAKLVKHKNANKGKDRELNFGPRAQEVLRRFLDRVPRPVTGSPLFSPAGAMAEHRVDRRSRRETPLWPSHTARYERERAQRAREGRSEQLSDHYDATTLRKAVERAVGRANRSRRKEGKKPLPRWTPYQLRHSALTRIRASLGLEAAKAIGGHATVLISEGYTVQAERHAARHAAAELG